MRTVYKYDLSLTDVSEIRMPTAAKIRHIDWQLTSFNSGIKIWVEIDPDNPTFETRKFHIYGTGQGISSYHHLHRGTVITPDGFVWHVYEDMAA